MIRIYYTAFGAVQSQLKILKIIKCMGFAIILVIVGFSNLKVKIKICKNAFESNLVKRYKQ